MIIVFVYFKKKNIIWNKWYRNSTNSVAASCGRSGIISIDELVVGVVTERFASWSDGEDIVVVDWEKAWVIDWSKDGLSTELRFFSVTDILDKLYPHVL